MSRLVVFLIGAAQMSLADMSKVTLIVKDFDLVVIGIGCTVVQRKNGVLLVTLLGSFFIFKVSTSSHFVDNEFNWYVASEAHS